MERNPNGEWPLAFECHCGKLPLAIDPDNKVDPDNFYHVQMADYYCKDCIENRCDTTNGILEGCPNGN